MNCGDSTMGVVRSMEKYRVASYCVVRTAERRRIILPMPGLGTFGDSEIRCHRAASPTPTS